MSREHFNVGSTRNFILAAFFGFAVVFCLLMFMMNWHGPYKPGNENEHNSATTEEHK